MLASFSACDLSNIIPPTPTPTPHQRMFVDITFEVEGTGGIDHANITYGRIDDEGNWMENQYGSEQNVELPYTATRTTCTGHYERLGISACNTQTEGSITLRIKDQGKTKVEKIDEGNCFLDSIKYYVPKNF